MIHLLGMSHMISILAASSAVDIGSQIPHSLDGTTLRFLSWNTKPGVLPEPMRFASIHRWHLPKMWGDTLASLANGVVKINPYLPELLKEVKSLEEQAKLFVSIMGQEHNDFSLRVYPIPADFEFPEYVNLPLIEGRQIVPLKSVEAIINKSMEPTKAILFAIRAMLPKARIINIIPPPPATTSAVAKIFNVTEDIVPPSSVRLKHYLIYTKIITEIANQLNIEILKPPTAIIGDDGLMSPEFAQDTHHGNVRYGEEVLRQMNELLLAGRS
jgi:hypothetical protein